MRKHKYVSKYSIISFKECVMREDVLSYAAFLAMRENILSQELMGEKKEGAYTSNFLA